ncbi:MAG: Sjogren's syndrome/scleroderma autoantigen 1 family protein [Conexivisphaera sp.]
MSSSDVNRLVVELMRRGASLLSETCPNCGGIMLRYKGVTFCPRCSGFTSIEEVEEKLAAPKDLLGDIEKLIYEGLREDFQALRSARGIEERAASLRSLREELEVLEILLRIKDRVSGTGK